PDRPAAHDSLADRRLLYDPPVRAAGDGLHRRDSPHSPRSHAGGRGARRRGAPGPALRPDDRDRPRPVGLNALPFYGKVQERLQFFYLLQLRPNQATTTPAPHLLE